MSDKPMASLEQIQLTTRLIAIEDVLAGLYAKVNRILGISHEQFAREAEELCQQLKLLPIPGVDPAQSDLFSAELEQAYQALLQKIADSAERRSPS
jgi:hypothetical protein